MKFRFLEHFFAHVFPYPLVTLLAHRRAGRTSGLFLISHNLCKKILANTNNPPSRALTIFALKLWFINHNSQIFCENFDLWLFLLCKHKYQAQNGKNQSATKLCYGGVYNRNRILQIINKFLAFNG